MVKVTNKIKTRIKKLSNKTTNLFDNKSNLAFIKRKDTSTAKFTYDKKNYEQLMSQIPDGIYKNVNELVERLEVLFNDYKSQSTTYSPIIQKHKVFEACKKISYNNGNIITGRDNEIDQILLTLCRRNKRGAIVIGEPGTGKTAIVREINTRLINGTVPFDLKGCKMYLMDIPYIFTHFKEDPISKIVDIIETASNDPNHILFIDEVHQLLTERFNDILKPYLTEGLRFIGSTTVDEYHSIVAKDKAIERRFTIININEPSIDETVDMMINTKKVFEEFHGCSISDEICRYTVENASRFLGHRKNPDKSFDILDKACTIMNVKDVEETHTFKPDEDDKFHGIGDDIEIMKSTVLTPGTRVLNESHINRSISDIAGIDYDFIRNSSNYDAIKEEFNNTVFGQEKATAELANIYNIMKCITYDRTRPISIALLVGTHGVGKSIAVETLTKILFGSKKNYIEYDMAQFTQEFQLTELKGAPPGYVGYEKSGRLIKELRNNPQSVVYFKHIDKAHQSIADYLLNGVKSGVLTDSAEKEVNLNNTVIIFSVSLEEEQDKIMSKNTIGFATNEKDEKESNNLDKVISKTILDAVDTTITFDKLEEEDYEKIFEANVDKIMAMYNTVDIDKEVLKKAVFEDEIKNGHDVMTKLTSIVPKMIFEKLSETK